MRNVKKILSVLLAIIFCLSALTAAASAAVVTAGDVAVGGTFYFGSYPQTRVTDSTLLARLNAYGAADGKVVSLNGSTYQCARVNGNTIPGGDQFMTIYGYEAGRTYWFRAEPIRWIVLNKDENGILLMCQNVLATHAYNKTIKADNTWEKSDVRAWLNGEFAQAAFSVNELPYILTSATPNADNPIHTATGIGGNDTTDKVFLPSFDEITDKSLGFNLDCNQYDDFGMFVGYYEKDALRQSVATDFARSQGVWVDTIEPGSTGDTINHDLDNVTYAEYPAGSGYGYSTTGRYWLRTGGRTANYAAAVLENGRVTTGWPVNYTVVGVRPWMRVSANAAFDGTYVPADTGSFSISAPDGSIRYRQPDLRLTANTAVTWTSSNPNVATIDENGNVTIVGVGEVTFIATDADGKTVSTTVEVRYTWWQQLIRVFLFGWLWY